MQPNYNIEKVGINLLLIAVVWRNKAFLRTLGVKTMEKLNVMNKPCKRVPPQKNASPSGRGV